MCASTWGLGSALQPSIPITLSVLLVRLVVLVLGRLIELLLLGRSESVLTIDVMQELQFDRVNPTGKEFR